MPTLASSLVKIARPPARGSARPGVRAVLAAAVATAAVTGAAIAAPPPAAAAAAVLFVAPSGTNAPNTCAVAASPCATVSYALTQASPAAMIHVSGTIHDNVSLAGNPGVTITGVNAPADAPAILDGSALAPVISTSVSLNVDHLTVRNGAANDSVGGGGVQVLGGTTQLTSVTVSGNVSATGGGGVASLGSVVITGSTISGNTSQGSWHGGGVLVMKGSGMVTNTTFSGNTAPNGGGMAIGTSSGGTFSGNVTVTNSTFTGNSADSRGGAIFISAGSTLQLSTSTLSGNSATFGGGLGTLTGASVTVIGSTIAGNAGPLGGAIANSFGHIKIYGSIVAANGTDCSNGTGGGTWVNAHSLVNDGTCGTGSGTGVVSGDPLLGRLASNGGPTQTMALSLLSPAANVIPPGTSVDGVELCPRTDQTGAAAPLPSQAACAMGAVEATAVLTAVLDTLYVAAGGTNTANTCTIKATPCATVSHALTQLSPIANPTTIRVSGTINDRFTVPASREITITGEGAASPAVVDGTSSGSVIANAAGAFLHLAHLTIQHGSGLGAGGGGIAFANGTATLSHVTVTDNTAQLSGGGIFLAGATFTITDSTISGNTTGLCGGCTNMRGGGGIYAGPSTTLSLVNSTVSGNTSTGGGNGSGGGLSTTDSAAVTVTGSTITGNTATSKGGGILSDEVTITNSTITGNTAVNGGGGLWGVGSSHTTVTASTISGNTSQNFGGGGAYVNFGTLTAGGSVFSGNSGGNCHSDTTATDLGVVSVGFNIDSDSTCGTAATGDIKNVDPNLGVLASNGGPTQTMLPAPGSPPIGKIPAGTTLNGVSTCPRTDQRGKAGPVSGQTLCTIGATEAGAGESSTFTSPASRTATGGTRFSYPVTTSGTIPATLSVSPATPLPPGVTFTDDGNGQGTLAGFTLPGTYSFTFIAANGVLPNTTQPFMLTVTKRTQNALLVTSLSGTFGTQLSLTSTGGSGLGAVTYAAVNGTATGCGVSGTTLTATSAGTCTVTATKAADANFNALSSAPTTVTFAKLNQSALTVTSISGTAGTPMTLTTSGGSGTGAVSYVAVNGSATGCTVNSSTLTVTSGGTCTVTATKAADVNYDAVSSAPTTVTFAKANQATLTVTSTGGTFGAPLTLATSGGSGTGAVTYVAVNGTAVGCAVSGSPPYTLSVSQVGTCTVTATKAGDGTYNSVASAPTTVTIAKANQAALSVTSVSGTFGSPLTLTTSGGSGTGAVTYLAVNGTATGCTVNGSTLTVTGAGTCTVTATKAADANHNAISSAPTTVTFAKANQAALSVTSVSGTFGSPLTLTTSGGSGTGAVSYVAVNGTATGCSVSGSTLTVASAGTCTVTATKAADGSFNVASSPPTTVTFVKANQAALTVTSLSGTFGSPLTLTASGGSGTGSLSYVAVNGTATGCSVSGSTLTVASAGTCTVTATKAADGSFNATSSGPTTVTFAKANQAALTVTSLSGTFGSPLTLTASGGSGGGAVTYVAVDGAASGCAVSGSTLTVASAGTCTVTATKAADVNYNAISSAPATVTFAKANQAALIVTSVDGTAGTPLTLTTSGGSGTGAVSFVAVNGSATGCTVNGSTLTVTSGGTCTVTATKAADVSYNVVSSAPTTVTFAKLGQAALAVSSTSGTFGAPLTLSTSGGSGTGTVTYEAVDGTAVGCTVSGSSPYTLSVSQAGTCTVTANKDGDGTYDPITSTPATVTFARATQAVLSVTSVSGRFGTPLTLTTSGGSGTGTVTFAAVNGTATGCTVNGSTLTSTTAGSCTVTATKATDVNFNAAASAATTVTLAANNAPSAGDDTYGANEDTALLVPAPGVLTNDTDGDAGPLTAGSASDPAGGAVTLNANGSFAYTPDANFVGTDTFTYTVSDGQGGTDTGAVTITVTATNGSAFHPLVPSRIIDSRPAPNTVGPFSSPWGPGVVRDVTVTGAGVPAGADAVTLNVTVTGTTGAGFLTIWPKGSAQPLASNLNWAPGQTIPNAVTVKVGAGGQISIANPVGTTHVIIDIVGYYDGQPGDGYTPLDPARILDSRPAPNQVGPFATPWGPGTTRQVTVTGAAGVPANADAVVLNATVTGTTAAGFLTIWPNGQPQPLASSLNWAPGQTIPNAVTVKVGTGGQVSVFNAVGNANVIFDVVGYFSAGTGHLFHPVTPGRVLDTRPPPNQVGPFNSPWPAATNRDVQISGNGGIPAGAAAALLNVTVTGGTAPSFLSVWPAGQAPPLVSSLNWAAGVTVPNSVTTKLNGAGAITVANAVGSVHVIADTNGWYG